MRFSGHDGKAFERGRKLPIQRGKKRLEGLKAVLARGLFYFALKPDDTRRPAFDGPGYSTRAGSAHPAAEGEEGEEEEVPAPKKKPAKPKPKAKPKSRARTPKVTRMRQVWGVYNNSNQLVTTYEYPKKDDALAHAAKLTADKKSTHFVQPVKEPMEEKKEA